MACGLRLTGRGVDVVLDQVSGLCMFVARHHTVHNGWCCVYSMNLGYQSLDVENWHVASILLKMIKVFCFS